MTTLCVISAKHLLPGHVITGAVFVVVVLTFGHHGLQNSLLTGMKAFDTSGQLNVLLQVIHVTVDVLIIIFQIHGDHGNVLSAIFLILLALDRGKAESVADLVKHSVLSNQNPFSIGLQFQKASVMVGTHGADDGPIDFNLLLLGAALVVLVEVTVDDLAEEDVAMVLAKRSVLASAQNIRVLNLIDGKRLESNGNSHRGGKVGNHFGLCYLFRN